MEQDTMAPARPTATSGGASPARRGGQSVLMAAGIVAAVSLLTKIVSFGREAVLAAKFGASAIPDQFNSASTLPVVAAAVAAGALMTATVPVLAKRYERDGTAGVAQLAGALAGLLALAGAAVGLLLLVLAPSVVQVVSPGFDPGQVAGAATLLRILLPALVFSLITAALIPALWVNGEFGAPALGLFGNSLTVVLMLLGLAAPFGIAAAAWGYVVAGVVQLLVLMAGLMYVRQPLRLRLWDADLPQVLRLAVPVLISATAVQLGLGLSRALGSYDEGMTTVLTYAFRVGQLPYQIFSAAIVTAVYPRLAAATKDAAGFRSALQQGLRLCVFVITPLAVGALLFRQEIVALIFERGEFSHAAALQTAAALGGLAPGIVALSLWDLSQRAFFARRESWPPVLVGAGAAALTLALGYALLPRLGGMGVGLAVSAGQIVPALALLAWLQARTGALGGMGLTGWLGRVALAALVAAAVGMAAVWGLDHVVHGAGKLAQVVRLGGVGALFLGAYAVAGFALGVGEVRQAFGKIARKLRRSS